MKRVMSSGSLNVAWAIVRQGFRRCCHMHRADMVVLLIMTRDEFESALKQAEISGAELARRCGIYPQAVSRWRTGQTKVPGPVAAYLRLLIATKTAIQSLTSVLALPWVILHICPMLISYSLENSV